MLENPIKSFVVSLLKIPKPLQNVVSAYLLTLMLETEKHTQSFAQEVTGIHQSQFSRLLSNQKKLAIDSLENLAKSNAKNIGKNRLELVKGSNWKIAIIVDATLHPRSSLHVQNSQRFNHGQGFVIGHQWTNIVLCINGNIVPLPPIPFFSKNECKKRKIEYKTEHEHLLKYLESLALADYVGIYSPDEVVVISDSGYDDKKLQKIILLRGWDFMSALKITRGTKSSSGKDPIQKAWQRVDDLFWTTRKQAPWKTIHLTTNGGKKRRRFRVRKLVGYIKGIDREIALICSEKSGGTGRRFFACSKTNLDHGVMMRVYALRWKIELFHRDCKQYLGFLDAGVKNYDAQMAHVHWVYVAWIMIHQPEIQGEKSLFEKRKSLTKQIRQDPVKQTLQKIVDSKTQFGGLERQQNLIAAALQDLIAA